MFRFLIRKFIKDYKNTSDRDVRQNYIILGGVVGIICNLFLFGLKFFIGVFMNSIAVTSDAFNNLSDTGSCFVSVIGAKMANKLPDNDHPFGHGRIEYISSLIVSFIIMLVGVELLRTSADKIINPSQVEFNAVMIAMLSASVLVKFWMYRCYSYIGKKINSTVMTATAKDSINDAVSTAAVIAATAAGLFLPFNIDGIIGVLVAGYIIYGGFMLSKNTIDLLLGSPPSKETVLKLEAFITEPAEIAGIHDLIVHDYGPGRVIASAHAEVPDDSDPVRIHEIIDSIERRIMEETGILMVLHTDPISVNDEAVAELKKFVEALCRGIEPDSSIHDFRITDGEMRTNLIFDIVIKGKYSANERNEIVRNIKKAISAFDSRYNAVITVDDVFS